jgi:hypothetical protein
MEHLYKKEQICFCSNWYRLANSGLLKVTLLLDPFVSEKTGMNMWRRIVQFVGNRWQRNIQRRRSPVPGVSTSGRARVALTAAVKKNRE